MSFGARLNSIKKGMDSGRLWGEKRKNSSSVKKGENREILRVREKFFGETVHGRERNSLAFVFFVDLRPAVGRGKPTY